jgi:phage-related baseplate assembly protein
MSIVDLSQLPPPDVVESLDFEEIYQDILADFRSLMGDGWSAQIESDPVVKLLQLAAYRELQIRARINDVARSSLIAFAAGADLDHAAAFYNVVRLPGESDERLRLRTQLRTAALAGNGTAEQYRFVAMSVSLQIRDAQIMPSPPGTVALAVWPTADAVGGDVLATVQAAFTADDAKPLGVPLTVTLASPRTLNVVATVYRESSAPLDLAAQSQAALPGLIDEYARLGRDIPDSWLYAKLHIAGVSRLQLTSEGITVANNEYVVPGNIQIHDGGVAW